MLKKKKYAKFLFICIDVHFGSIVRCIFCASAGNDQYKFYIGQQSNRRAKAQTQKPEQNGQPKIAFPIRIITEREIEKANRQTDMQIKCLRLTTNTKCIRLEKPNKITWGGSVGQNVGSNFCEWLHLQNIFETR